MAKYQSKLSLLILGAILLLSSVACNNAGVIGNAPTQAALESTVVAMQATLESLNTQPVQQATVAEPTPQIIVVTATSTDTPLPSPTSLPTDTATPLPIPTEMPTNTPASHPQSNVVIIIATPTTPPSPTPSNEAPVNLTPPEGTVVEQGREILLQWSWNGLLGPHQFYEVKLRPDGQPRSAYIAQELGEGHNFLANLSEGRYYWTVQLVQGYFVNDSDHPDDWVFEGFLGPESEPSLLIIAKNESNRDDDDDDGRSSPPSQSQADEPAPTMPFGLLVGSIAFVTFIGLTRWRNVGY